MGSANRSVDSEILIKEAREAIINGKADEFDC